MMINNMNEFIKEHPHAVIVNYDIADKFECGKTYRTSTNKTEEFRKDKKGKYVLDKKQVDEPHVHRHFT